jgi:tetratricopeptide (TPR) repeat protein
MRMIAEGHLRPALEELRRAAVAQPTDGGAARELALLLHVTGDRRGAAQWLREAVRRDPENGLAYVDLAVCLMEAGEVADGLNAAEEAVRACPRLHSAQLVLGRALWESGDPAGARAAFDEALLLRPRDVDTLLAAVTASRELGLEDSALGYARRAVAADPESARTWLVLAGVLAATGRAVDADEALSRARSLDPTTPLFQSSAGANGGGRHAASRPQR